jgi:hypothetical protein
MIQKGRPKITYITFLAMTEPFKDRRCIVECFYELDFGDGKFFASLEKYIPGNA